MMAWTGPAVLAAILAVAAQVATAQQAPREIAPGVHVREGVHEEASPANLGGIANVAFVIGDEAVAVIDPGGSLADGERLRASIRRVTQLPIRYVVMTHVHPDHVFGAAAFREDKPAFIGHANLPKALAQRGEYYRARLADVLGESRAGEVVMPDTLVESEKEIDLGNRVLRLTAHPLAHTGADLSVLDTKTKTLFLSDLLFMRRIASLDGSLQGWIEVLSRLQDLKVERVVPGHGPASAAWPAASRDLERYLGTVQRETREAIGKGLDMDQSAQSVARQEAPKWLLFEDYHGRNVTRAFRELEWE